MGWFKPLSDIPDEVTVRRNARARRMTLRVSRLDGRVTLTVPPATTDRAARAFLDGHADWIAKAKAGTPSETRVRVGAELPVEGVMRRIEAGSGRQLRPGRGGSLEHDPDQLPDLVAVDHDRVVVAGGVGRESTWRTISHCSAMARLMNWPA